MSSYEMRAIRFIQQIFSYITDCSNMSEYQTAINHFNIDHGRKVKIDCGQTRIALITSDYVVKIDYNPSAIKRWGGCEKEHKFYEMAYREGFGYLFAKIKPYYFHGQVFYIMPRVYGIGRYWYDADEYMTDEECAWCDKKGLYDLHMYNYGWKNDHIIIIDYGANR